MPAMGVMSANDWIEAVIKPVGSNSGTEGGVVLGFELHMDGQKLACFERDKVNKAHPSWRAFGYRNLTWLPQHVNMLLALCVAVETPNILRDLGFEVSDDGSVRVVSFGLLKAFRKALDGNEKEKSFQQSLRNIIPDQVDERETLLGFRRLEDDTRWMFLRGVGASQIRIAPDVLEAITKRLRGSLSSDNERTAKEDPYAELASTLTALIKLLHGVVASMSEETMKKEGARWIKRIERWVPRILEALRARTGRAALMKLVMAVAFPRQPATRDQIREMIDAMGPDGRDALEAIVEQAHREAERSLCRDVLRAKFNKLTDEIKNAIDSAGSDQLRGWLLLAFHARTLSDVFGSRPARPRTAPSRKGSANRSKATPRPTKVAAGSTKKPSTRKKNR